MAQDDPSIGLEDAPPVMRRRRWPVVAAAAAGILIVALIAAWLSRDRIAGAVIGGQLQTYGLPATYKIESIGPGRQVLRDVVVGDPKRPDMTIERVETVLSARFGAPAITAVTLVRPRLYGAWRGDRLSFGSLDKLIYGGKPGARFRLPDMALTIVDGRGLIESGYGAVGIKAQGSGALRGGFAGTIAAIAPRIDAGGCTADRATAFGTIRISSEKSRFTGPVRLGRLACDASHLALGASATQLDATFDPAFDGVEGKAVLRGGTAAYGGNRLAAMDAALRFTWRKAALTAHYDLGARGVATPHAAADALKASGVVRTAAGRQEIEGEANGAGIALGSGLDAALLQAQRSGAGTLLAPLAGQIRAALLREGKGSRLAASYILRREGARLHVVVPQAALRGGSGDALLTVSHVQLSADGTGRPRLAGNFATGGAGLPRIAGRIERPPGGALVTRMTLAEYAAADARIAVPRLTLVQLANGALGFSGEARVSGALPGGRAQNLILPIAGNWGRGGLALWRSCAALRFDRLELAQLVVDRRALTLCPPRGQAILAYDGRALRIAAGAPSLDVTGRLGETPIRLRSGAVGFAMPGAFSAKALDIALGPPATASRFRIANLGARIGSDVAGRFAGADVRLGAVPLDILEAAGAWRFAAGKLSLSEGQFRLQDRQTDARFQPLIARGAVLDLAGNAITASAVLREPASERVIVEARIRHDLASGRGNADLAVPGITFDQQLQPDAVSRLALGVIANGRGTVTGDGRIDWTPQVVTSRGAFATENFDFAAAFGPVKGASGRIVFTDLLGMVSAPDQTLRIASINPGIEVNDGVITYELRPESVLAVKGGVWPFLDGSLTLLPSTMRMGVAETRRYTLMIEGLNAARLIERMQMANLTATGTFDGTLPLVFDENGGKIDGGQLRARPPGGNVSYVGALTYKDLSAMANFAFDALKSLDYREMSVTMNGRLEGEIITRVQMEGIRQGSIAKRNFLTNRIAQLPIRFNVNLRAPFFQLASSFRSLYDPAYVRDPRTLGLLDAQGKPVAQTLPKGAIGIQPPESGKRP